MKNLLSYLLFTLLSYSVGAADIKIIELNNKSIDQLINEGKFSNSEGIIISNNNENNTIEVTSDANELNLQSNNLITELPGIWENIKKEEVLFLLDNITQINSKKLKMELLNSLSISQNIPKEFDKEDFEKLIIDTLLMLGDRKKAYEILQSIVIGTENKYEDIYKKFSLNYLLSSYKLSEACSLRNTIEEKNILIDPNFYLKLDIFCLVLNEKYDEANLLNSLLIESVEGDQYFQTLFEKLQNQNLDIKIDNKNINEKNIFLYSAMHRVGNLPLSSAFLEIDPMNLSIPIILSSSTDINLRIKSAHYAFFNNLISVDSLAALYQTVDFSYDELNNSSNFIKSIENNIEISMSYFYQLINIQLLPTTRISAIVKFWNFAKENNFEEIAYTLSLKSLNTIDPSNELAIYGPNIARAYIYNKDFDLAKKWLVFSENLLTDDISIKNLNSSKLLFNLSNFKNDSNFNEVLLNNLNKMMSDYNEKDQLKNNELFYLLLSSLSKDKDNTFQIHQKIIDDRPMPSLFMMSLMRSSLENNIDIQLLLSILVSMNGKTWNELHPEHFRLILLTLENYKQGDIYNDMLLEILYDNNII